MNSSPAASPARYRQLFQHSMTSIKLILTGLLSVLTICCLGQTTHVLKLKNKKYFDEKNQFLIDSSLKVIQKVGYDEPHTVDESYSLILTLEIVDTLNARLKKDLDLTIDTALIRCHFDISSVWNWEDEKTTITGNIVIVSWTNEKLEFNFNVTVLELRNSRTFIYKGNRVFSKIKAS